MLRPTLILAFACVLAVTATAQNVAQKITNIRAAVALIDSDTTAGYLSNRTPFVWLNIDSNSKVKPAGYTFTNPSRETQWSGPLSARWTALGGSAPAAGSPITKRDAPYWEMSLSTASEDQLARTDVLLLSAYGNTSLNPLEREKLRHFMDKGGVLWVDLSSTTSLDAVNNFPLPFSIQTVPSGGAFQVDYSNPLMTYPLALTDSDVVNMQSENAVGSMAFDLGALGFGALEGIMQPLAPDSLRIQPVAVDTLGNTISVGRVGDGYMVVTSRGVARSANRIPTGAGTYLSNQGAQAQNPSFDRSSDAAAKLVMNMVFLVSGHSQSGKGARMTKSTAIDLGAPQLQRFADTTIPLNPAGTLGYNPPVLFKGMLVVTSQDRISVYDANPRQDLDGDGDPDDGERDFARGSSYDLLWTSAPLAGPISSAVCTEVPDAPNTNLKDQILVVDANGTLQGFSAFRYDVNGKIQGGIANPDYSVVPSTGAASYDFGVAGAGPYAAVVHDGLVYIADAQDSGLSKVGRVWMVDPATGQQVKTAGNGWSVGGVGAGAVIPDISAPPTIGYIPIQDNSGGFDKVIYVATRAGTLGPTSTAGVTSIWAGVKGERPTSVSDGGGVMTVTTRAASQGLDVYIPGAGESKTLGVRLTVLRPTGDALTTTEMNNTFTGHVTNVNGILTFDMQPLAILPVNYSVRVDYSIDWGTGSPALTSQVVRGQFNLPDDVNRTRRILQSVALSSQGTMHLVCSSQVSGSGGVPGGSYFAIREEGRGNFRVLNRFDLYDPHTINLNQANDVQYPETLKNSDPLVMPPSPVAGFLGGRMQRLTFMGSPSVTADTTYVTAKGIKPLGLFAIPYAIVMAFPTEPDGAQIRVGDLSSGFTILQPDVTRSTFTSGTWTPDTFSVLQPNQYVYEKDPGKDSGTIRIDNLSATSRGPIQNCLSTSQPLIIRRNGQPDILFEPNSANSKWNRMQWYTVFSGVDVTSPAFVSGNTLFMAGASSWPTILAGLGFSPAGQVFGMDATVSANDPYLNSADLSRPWLKQEYQLVWNGASVRSNPIFRWPQLTGSMSFNDYGIRLQQSVLKLPGGGYASPALGVVGGDGALATWSNDGIWAFAKADFVFADEGRVARFDSVGNPIWSISGTYQTGRQGDIGGAGDVKPLVRPTRAYPMGDRQVLVVDTGASRILRLDVSGRELRAVGGYSLDPVYRPDGYESNENPNLVAPRDAYTYTTIVKAASNPFADAQPFESWTHYVVADSGNKRLIDLVDRYRYDPLTRHVGNVVVYTANGQPALSVLYWHSPAAYSGGKFAYTSLSRTYVDDPLNPRYVYVAGIGSALPARADLGLDSPSTAIERRAEDGNGGIVVFDGPNTQVITQVSVPAIAANVYYDFNAGNFSAPGELARVKRLGNLNSVSVRTVNNGTQLSVMFTDGEGVFEIVGSGSTWDVVWMLPKKAYIAIRRDPGDNLIFTDNPVDFRPTYAKRLDSGEVLVCNGYSGWYQRLLNTDSRSRFTGEILLLDGDFDGTGAAPFGFGFGKLNLGFKSLSIHAQLDNKLGAERDGRGVISPMFADRK